MVDSTPWWRRRPGQPADDTPPAAAAAEAPSSDAEPVSGPRGERTKTVAVRLTPDEHAEWLVAAAADGRGQMGRWVRESITDHLTGRTGPKQVEGLREMRADLSRAGSNLNQIARALNIANINRSGSVDLRRVAAVIESTRLELATLRNRLQELE
jgi:hypothetical protein